MTQTLASETSTGTVAKQLNPGDFVIVTSSGRTEDGSLMGVFKFVGRTDVRKFKLVNAPDIPVSDRTVGIEQGRGQYQLEVYAEDIVAICSNHAQAWEVYRGLRAANQKKREELVRVHNDWSQATRELLRPFTPSRL